MAKDTDRQRRKKRGALEVNEGYAPNIPSGRM